MPIKSTLGWNVCPLSIVSFDYRQIFSTVWILVFLVCAFEMAELAVKFVLQIFMSRRQGTLAFVCQQLIELE